MHTHFPSPKHNTPMIVYTTNSTHPLKHVATLCGPHPTLQTPCNTTYMHARIHITEAHSLYTPNTHHILQPHYYKYTHKVSYTYSTTLSHVTPTWPLHFYEVESPSIFNFQLRLTLAGKIQQFQQIWPYICGIPLLHIPPYLKNLKAYIFHFKKKTFMISF